jgi:uncharacterized protein YeaC (DUF1315 family)
MVEENKKGFDQLFLQRPESVEQLLDCISPEVYNSLKLAIEIGKWEDGKRLSPEQLEFCMQAVILYEAKNFPEQERVGYALATDCKSKGSETFEQPISIGNLQKSKE